MRAHLAAALSEEGTGVELRAVDGSVTRDVPAQLSASPIQTPCLFVLSSGGNDALIHIEMFWDQETCNFSDTMILLREIKEDFRTDYQAALQAILEYEQPLIVCTIYNPMFKDTELRGAAEAALSIFNDVIVEEALSRDLEIIDLRSVCSDPKHFANEIEPSEEGGIAICEAIVKVSLKHCATTA